MPWVEPKSRMLLIALATVSLMSACALTRNTTPQDLVGERIEDAASVQGLRTVGRGDQWTYRWASPDGSGTDVLSTDRDDVVDGIDCYVTRRRQRERFRRTTDLASVKDAFGGDAVSRYSPPRLNCVWPLEIETSWDQSFTEAVIVRLSLANALDQGPIDSPEAAD